LLLIRFRLPKYFRFGDNALIIPPIEQPAT
jgi:hypothetical protein